METQEKTPSRISFFVPGTPQAVQSAKVGRVNGFVRLYQPAKVVHFKEWIRLSVAAQISGMPDDIRGLMPFRDEPLSLRLLFAFAPPKSMRKRDAARVAAGEMLPKITKPDVTDNLPKGVVDALKGLVWSDDAIIVACTSRKVYAAREGVHIAVSRWTEEH